MRASGRFRLGAALVCVGAVVGVAACGGSEQDAHEPSGKFKVEVSASFPKKQKLAKRSTLVITVKNLDRRALPNPTVTINSFNRRSNAANLADPSRPVFIVNRGPRGGETANQATSAWGRPLKSGEMATFKWNVTAVHAGPYKIGWTVSAGLFGKAVAIDSNGQIPKGQLSGRISNAAPRSTVNFKNGKTVEGD